MNCTEFQSSLRQSGAYQTASRPAGWWLDRLLGRFDFWYYLRTCGIVAAAGTAAKRGKYDFAAWSESSFRIMKLIEACGGRIAIDGADNLARSSGPVVVMANHMSVLETVLLPVIMLSFGPMAVVVKQSLLDYPLFGAVLRALPTISVTRQDPRGDLKTVLENSVEHLQRGCSILLFPQATRSPVLRPDKLNTLAVKVARRGGVPIVVLALKTDFQGIGRLLRDFGKLDRGRALHFAFDAPFGVEGNGRDAMARAKRFIVGNVRRWGGVVEDGTQHHDS